MAVSRIGYRAFRLTQLTGIPLTRICEVACDIAYKILLEHEALLEEVSFASLRSTVSLL